MDTIEFQNYITLGLKLGLGFSVIRHRVGTERSGIGLMLMLEYRVTFRVGGGKVRVRAS